MDRIPYGSRLDGQGPQYLMHLESLKQVEHTKVALDEEDTDIFNDRIGSAMSSMSMKHSSAWTQVLHQVIRP